MTAPPKGHLGSAPIVEEERQRLMAPLLGRLQTARLGPVIARVFRLLQRQGALPELPEEPREPNPAGEAADYVSPMAKAQRAVEVRAILRTYESAGAMARFAPEALGVLDHAGALRRVAEAVAQQQQQQAMQAGLGQRAQLTQQGGGAAKDLATAASATGVPGGGRKRDGRSWGRPQARRAFLGAGASATGVPGGGRKCGGRSWGRGDAGRRIGTAPSGETAGARQAVSKAGVVAD